MLPKRQKHEQPVIDPRDAAKPSLHPEPTKHTLEVLLDRNQPDRIVKIESKLLEEERVQLIDFLIENADVFAWSPKDMPGID